jgi:hypothetical protein
VPNRAPLMPADLLAIAERELAAHAMISDLCHRRREWIMSIPARPDHDPDLVIGASLRDVLRLLREIHRLRSVINEVALTAAAPTSGFAQAALLGQITVCTVDGCERAAWPGRTICWGHGGDDGGEEAGE